MALVGSQRFSANSFSGFGSSSRRAASMSVGRSVAQSSSSGFGGGAGLGAGGGFSYGGAGSARLSYGAVSGGSSGYGMSYGGGSAVGGGLRVGLSQASAVGSGFGMGSGAGVGFGMAGGAGAGYDFGGMGIEAGPTTFAVSEKKLLQSLNDRLSSYLDKVRMLETTNRELEEKLRAFTVNKVQTRDLQVYEEQLKPLRQQLLTLMQENSRLALEVDNAKLAADDFRMKLESEYNMRQSVEGDIAGLKALRSEYEFSNTALNQELQMLAGELTAIKKNHHEEVITLRGEMAGTVTVDVQAANTTNLSQILEEIRSEYETVVQKNRQEVEGWYTKQMEIKQVEQKQTTETAVTTSSEIVEGRKQSLSLQTELDTLIMSKTSVEDRLVETETQYQIQLQRLNSMVVTLENELANVREGAMQQAQEYQNLLNLKVKLEMEIATYKQLLEGADLGFGVAGKAAGGGYSMATKSSSSMSSMSSGASRIGGAAMSSDTTSQW
ncbi:keratin, type I cytoskeletal 47 kDa-like [Megalops cyprinoides]|uniref:keratin, type I cytoskeletal 47 kDa-like n=1 Tax=Megalops cyprinoides TaxID=118141 RepID=UPI001864E85C|nr:keratin, type I cytoskeletal 47 kDa-like [Megalops cyprinoides]